MKTATDIIAESEADRIERLRALEAYRCSEKHRHHFGSGRRCDCGMDEIEYHDSKEVGKLRPLCSMAQYRVAT